MTSLDLAFCWRGIMIVGGRMDKNFPCVFDNLGVHGVIYTFVCVASTPIAVHRTSNVHATIDSIVQRNSRAAGRA